MTDQKIPEMARIEYFMPTIEKRARISGKKYLGNDIPTPLQTKTNEKGYKYIGELNPNGEEHGRGIALWIDDRIYIGYW
jgi:hypothetical protein